LQTTANFLADILQETQHLPISIKKNTYTPLCGVVGDEKSTEFEGTISTFNVCNKAILRIYLTNWERMMTGSSWSIAPCRYLYLVTTVSMHCVCMGWTWPASDWHDSQAVVNSSSCLHQRERWLLWTQSALI